MEAFNFPQANATFVAPSELSADQCKSIKAFVGQVQGGSCDGTRICVVAYELTPEERERVAAGAPIFVSMLYGIPPHYLCLSFEEATHPA